MGHGEGFENASAIGVIFVTVAALCAASFQVGNSQTSELVGILKKEEKRKLAN